MIGSPLIGLVEMEGGMGVCPCFPSSFPSLELDIEKLGVDRDYTLT